MCPASTPGLRLEFTSSPSDFLAAAGEHLASDPVISTVVNSIAHRALSETAAGIDQHALSWWLVVRDRDGAVVGTGMRTAPFEPRPLFLLPMPDEAAVALARILHGRHEEVVAANGALPTVEVFAEELAGLTGARVEVSIRTRLHELGELVSPPPAPGQLVPATEDDLDLVAEWFDAFMGDADEQAGRPRGSGHAEAPDRDVLLHRIRNDGLWFWVDESGTPVHMTGVSEPSFGVSRIGPVYTPPEQRGRGWAGNAVAEISRRLQEDGTRVCLYTDQANPTSNRLYEALGYRPVVDMANLAIVR